jgi:excisionase family DNA binding protein
MENGDHYISTRKAAEILGVTIRTIQNWVDTGKLNARITLGGHRRLLRHEVEALATGESQKPVRHTPKADEKLRILVVEDNLEMLELYRIQIASFNIPCEAFFAKDGLEGLLLLGRHLPHLIVIDLLMPGMDGFQLLQTLKKMPEYAHTKAVIVTGMEASAIQARGGIPPDVHLLPKPVPFKTLETLCLIRANELGLLPSASA